MSKIINVDDLSIGISVISIYDQYLSNMKIKTKSMKNSNIDAIQKPNTINKILY